MAREPGPDRPPADPRSFFGAHAADFARSEGHRTGEDLGLLVEALAPLEGRACLDVATGTGFAAVALARAGARVTALDLTREMLAETAALARREGVDLTLVEGDAAHLPFPDGAFTRVSCRRAAHHFPDVAAFLREAHRVLAPGGTLALADMSPPARAGAFQDGIERMRDPSHRHALSPEEWQAAFAAAGFEVVACTPTHERQDFERWYYPVTDAGARERILAALAEAPRQAAEAIELARDASGRWALDKQRVVVSGRRRG